MDTKEEKPYDYPYLHTWVIEHLSKMLFKYVESKKEPLIPAGTALGMTNTTIKAWAKEQKLLLFDYFLSETEF